MKEEYLKDEPMSREELWQAMRVMADPMKRDMVGHSMRGLFIQAILKGR